MKILKEGFVVLTGGTDRMIAEGTGVNQLPGTTSVCALLVRAQHGNTNTEAALVGISSVANHYVDPTDKKGFYVLHSGNASDFKAVGTANDVLFWTAFG